MPLEPAQDSELIVQNASPRLVNGNIKLASAVCLAGTQRPWPEAPWIKGQFNHRPLDPELVEAGIVIINHEHRGQTAGRHGAAKSIFGTALTRQKAEKNDE